LPSFDLTETARSLLTMEANTIVRDNMTGEPMPPLPHALLDIAGEYAGLLCAIGVDLPASFATPRPDPVKFAPALVDNVGSASDLLTVSVDTFDRLRWAAKYALRSRSSRITPAIRILLDRIINNSDAIKEMFKRFDPRLDQFKDKSRAELVAMTIHRNSYAVPVDDLIQLQKMWDIGIQEIVAQTIVHITGDVTTRVQSGLGRPGSEALFAIHRQSVDVSVACWRYLLDVVREIAGTTIQALIGRSR
jgi:hypothetical protein